MKGEILYHKDGKINANKVLFKTVVCLIASGLTIKDVAEHLGCEETTLYRWLADNEGFWDQLEETRQLMDRQVEKALFQRAVGMTVKETKLATYNGVFTDEKVISKHIPPDVDAAKWWLKNRRPNKWKDRKEINFDPAEMTDEELVYTAENILLEHKRKNNIVEIEAEQKNDSGNSQNQQKN